MGAVDLVSGNNISFSLSGNQLTITAASGGSAIDNKHNIYQGTDPFNRYNIFFRTCFDSVTDINLLFGKSLSGGLPGSTGGGTTE
jgi:hypothetical protein